MIGATTTTTGLKINSTLDPRIYPTKVKVSDEALKQVRLHRNAFHGEWNYKISCAKP